MAPAIDSYRAPAWLPGGHAQTIWPLLCKGPSPRLQRERWRTPDGDLVLPWSSGSLPLGPGGDASIGAPRLSSKAYGKPVITRSPKKRGKK